MPTIAQRLRNAADDWRRVSGDPLHATAVLMDEAAKEIARLEDLVLYIAGERNQFRERLDDLQEVVDELKQGEPNEG